jgi:glycerophosphoryl diester phosphodiesterase
MKSNRKILFVFSSLLFLIGNGFPQDLPQRGLCAHRGANNTHPENTLTAFREAIRLGAHMIEFDVQMSRDGVLVIMHDKTVDRTTNGKGRVPELSLSELKNLDAGSWKKSIYKGERVPTLQETIDIMPMNIWLNIHVKDNHDIGREVAYLIIKNNRLHQAVIACKPETAKSVLKVDPRIKICNMDRGKNSNQYVTATIELKSDFIQLKNRADPLLPGLIKRLKPNGIRINYYGTNSADKLKHLFAAGVDFPLVDDLPSMMKAAIEIGIEPLEPLFGEKNE